jgi:ABC-type Fe3+ transport system substrate-binding protein
VTSLSFSLAYDSRQGGSNVPRTAPDLLDPRWKGRIASTFPNDDDAVLHLYERAVTRHGWDWLERLVAQDVHWVRGTQSPADQVAAGTKAVAYGVAVPVVPYPGQTSRFVVPAQDEPFVSWGQRAALLKGAHRPAAAKLSLNWAISLPVQQASFQWSVRTDVEPPKGFRRIWEYRNAGIPGFEQFMADRARVERFRQHVTLIVGEVSGPPSPGWLGLYPGA